MKQLISLILATGVLLLIACGGKEGSSGGTDKSPAKKETTSKSSNASSSASNKKGKLIYKQYCVACHGADGKLGISGAKDLSISELALEERINQVTNGKGLMTPYKDILSKDQIQSVCEYIAELRK